MGLRTRGLQGAARKVGLNPDGGAVKAGRAASWAGGWGGRAALFAANPALGTVGAIAEGTYRTGKAMRGGIRNVAMGEHTKKADALAALGDDSGIAASARRFAIKRPGVTAAGAAMVAGPAIYSGGPGSGSRVSSRNQNSYYVRRMRSGQASGVAGLNPNSLGGFA